jgi:mannose-6-phosphate isomerase-like protein (cupin superfamily)
MPDSGHCPTDGSSSGSSYTPAITDYTVKNLMEVENQAPKFGIGEGLEARFAARDLGLEQSGVSFQRFSPGFRSPFGHHHHEQEELYVVVEGGGRAKLGNEIVELRQWDALRVAADTMRAFEAGPDGLAYIAFGAPATGPGDADMAPGWWNEEPC